MKINQEDKTAMTVRHFSLAANCVAISGWIIGCAAATDEHGGHDGPSDSLTFEAIDDGLSDSAATADVFVECEEGTQCESAFELETASDSSEEVSHRVIFDVPVRLFNFFDDRYTESLTFDVVSQLNSSPVGEAAGFRFAIAPNDVFEGNAPSDMSIAQSVSFVRNYHRQNPGTRRSDRLPLYVFRGLAWSSDADLGGFAMIPGILRTLTPQTSGVYLNYYGFDSLSHEVGHWLGLSHTFRGGCNPLLGDYVSDTPAHNLSNHPYSWCNAALDTCSSPGRDPIRNLMNYTPCNPPELTNGQITRMRTIWQEVYAPLFS